MGKPLFKEQFSIFPQLTYCPQYDPAKYEEIQAFYFEGMPLGDEKTRVFAYMACSCSGFGAWGRMSSRL